MELSGCTVRLFHPKGPAVTLGLPAGDPGQVMAAVAACLEAGWLTREPGLEAGEKREEIGYVVRRTKYNEDGSRTPIIDLYPSNDRLTFCTLSLYLNTPADVAAFEAASGMKVASLREYDGENKIERGKNPRSDSYVTRAPKPFGMVWQDNPFYNADEAAACKASGKPYIKPKRRFVRWPDLAAPPPADGGEKLGVAAEEMDRGLAAAASVEQLQKVWVGYVQPAWKEGRLTQAELDHLTATKDTRKMTLESQERGRTPSAQTPPANYGAAGGAKPSQAVPMGRPAVGYGAAGQSGPPVTQSAPATAPGEIPW